MDRKTPATLTVVSLLAFAPSASALTKREAESAVREAARISFAGFSETPPFVAATCKIDRRYHAVCRARYTGDRLNVVFRATVAERLNANMVVRFSRLTISP